MTNPNVTVTPGNPEQPCYPQTDSHLWGAFAILAIESGGYGDLDAVDPYSGRRINAPVGRVDSSWDKPLQNINIYDQLRRLVDLMQAEKFLG